MSAVAGNGKAPPFASGARESTRNADPLDSAGQSILNLLHNAAEITEQNNKLALEAVRTLSLRLEEANKRIEDVEADLKYYQERAQKAEQWFSKISLEIEQAFLSAEDGHRPSDGPSLPRLRRFPKIVESTERAASS